MGKDDFYMINAYLKVLEKSIIYAKFLASESHGPVYKHLANKKKIEQVGDILDAIHVTAELIPVWERCDEKSLRECFLEEYDKKWAKEEDSFSMIKILEKELEEM